MAKCEIRCKQCDEYCKTARVYHIVKENKRLQKCESNRSDSVLPNFRDLYFTIEPSNVITSRGESVVLICRIQSSVTSVSIKWLKDGKVLDVRRDRRRSILSNGSLHISPVQPRDDRGMYQCQATLSNLGTIISRTARLDIAYLSRNFVIEPQNLTVYLHEIAMFQCQGDGLPTPNVTWYKGDVQLTEKSNIRIYQSGVLEINPVKFADFVRYYCKVEDGDKLRSSINFTLSQNADAASIRKGITPYFVLKPRDTIVEAGSSTILFCGANGKTKEGKPPTITWLKDGLTIDFRATQGRLQLTGNASLQIHSVNESDSGTYSCRADNSEDSVDADAVLKVVVKPRFVRRLVNEVAQRNSDLFLRCDIYGIPKPTIYWVKNGQNITETGYIQVVEDKHLRILGLLPRDAGLYQCMGSNPYGSVQGVLRLTVQDPAFYFAYPHIDVSLPLVPSRYSSPYLGAQYGDIANLPTKPRNLTAAIVSKRFVTLKWESPLSSGATSITAYSVFWRERGSERERVLNTTESHLEANIQHLKPNTNYEFRVQAYNTYGPSPKFASLTVLTDKDVDVPSPAVNVRATPLSPHSILVQWDPPQMPKGIITKYILIYYEVGVNGEHRKEVKGTTFTLTSLKAFREYSFRVIAVNENGEGMSTEEFVAITFSDKPSSPPKNPSLETVSATVMEQNLVFTQSLIVRWEPPPPDSQNGVITGYKIRYKKRSGEVRGSKSVTTDGNRRLYALTDLDKNSEYQVKISALTVNGSGPASERLRATTYKDDLDESAVPPPPQRIRVTPYAHSIRVSWSSPNPESKVLVRGYTLGWGKGVADDYQKVLDADTHVYTIEHLHPSSEYVITVRAFNNRGDGQPRYQTATTSEETFQETITPMMPPVGLKTIVLSPSTVVLTWSDTSLGTNQVVQDNRFYTVRYRAVSDSGRYRLLNSTDLNAHIDNLRPNTRYEFEVKVIKGRRTSEWSMKEVNKTKEAAPGSAPRDLTPIPKENDPTAVTVNWQPPAKPNGQITGYLVYYTTDATHDVRDWVYEGVLGDELSATIRHLTLDTTYYFKVQARNSKGYGPSSQTIMYKTPTIDGNGGGKVDAPKDPGIANPGNRIWNYSPTNPGSDDKSETDKKSDGGVGGLSTGIINIIIASVVGTTFCVVIVVVAIIYCKRRDNNDRNKRTNQNLTQSPNKGKPQGSAKPDVLWINDIEMKNVDKPDRSESMLTMSNASTLQRRSSNEYRSMDDLPPYHPDIERNFGPDMYYHPPSESEERERFLPPPRQQGSGLIRPKPTKPMMIPVDTQPPPREPVAMVTALPTGPHDKPDPHGMMGPGRPGFPRTQYNSQYSSAARVNAGDMPQPSSNLKSPDCTSVTPVHTQPMAVISPDQKISHDGHKSLPRPIHHPLRSFSVPCPPTGGPQPGVYTPKHQIVKPQQSPYKKATPSVSIKPRAIPIISTPKAPDVVLKAGKEIDPDIQKSVSTEELTAEMANLDCLMKDLNAITQQNFEC
ncbi:hypothetical protein FSP39_003463 [Pinctada imbricata]|uniref:Neogenin n=1 Tax=Pinctada imbricata TaxID=66713 RepID=A0AA88XYS5_PINIB|nr:hypothetical protein FSP39_003463 [Pinctada imbricata]